MVVSVTREDVLDSKNVILVMASAVATCVPAAFAATAYINQVGYRPADPKELSLVEGSGDVVIQDASGKTVLTATPKAASVWDASGQSVQLVDFSELKEPGKYSVKVGGNVLREDLVVKEETYKDVFKAAAKWFYYQRASLALEEQYAGQWKRAAGHLDENVPFHNSTGANGSIKSPKGWYDAGDYGKYIVNGGVSVATLLLACEMVDGCECESLVNQSINATEPFVGPDGLKMYSLKDEVRFELEFFLRMQDTDGGVFFKVTPQRWDGFVSPSDSDLLQKRMILGKSTTSTLNFAGALAAASRVYRNRDTAFAERCLQSAVSAYKWAVSRPFVDWPHNTEGSGGYGDEHAEDEFFWARAMLYRELHARGEAVDGVSAESLRPLLLEDMKVIPPKSGLDWRDTQNLGWIALALQDFDREFQLYARTTLNMTAREIIDLQNCDAYGVPMRKFIWGSNGDIANHALTLAIVKRWAPSLGGNSLDFWCRELLNFIYGRNPVDVSFVTGSAWSSPKDPHHRLSHSDGVKDPIPGLLVGGINSDRQDMHRAPHYPGELSGYSYTDERCSFASNETAINWNAPLTAVLALLCF